MQKPGERSITGAFQSVMLCLDRIERKVDAVVERRKSGVPKTPTPPEPDPEDPEDEPADVDGESPSIH